MSRIHSEIVEATYSEPGFLTLGRSFQLTQYFTWPLPFARMHATTRELRFTADLLGLLRRSVQIPRQEIVALRWVQWSLTTRLLVEHCCSDQPPLIIFGPMHFRRLASALAELGYAVSEGQ